MKKNSIKNMESQITDIRKNQKDSYDIFVKTQETVVTSLIKQFNIITKKKENHINRLEKAFSNVKTTTVKIFKEQYKSTNINDNYIIIDSIQNNSMNGSSNWKIEKYTNGNFFSSITENSFIKSEDNIYGSYILYRYTKLYKGFISLDIKLPYEGSFGIIFKYKDDKNYHNFIINRNEFYFLEVINGTVGNKINYTKTENNIYNFGMWIQIHLDFGNKYIRTFINKKFVCGYETRYHTYGFLGFGVNHCKEKIFIDKLVIGSLDQTKYYSDKMGKKNNIQNIFPPTIYLNKNMQVLQNGTKKKKQNKNFIFNKYNKEHTISIGNNNSNGCIPFEENFHTPLDNNWIIPENNNIWHIKRKETNIYLPSILKNFKNIYKNQDNSETNNISNDEENYLYSIKKTNQANNILIPSILLLNKQHLCTHMKSYTFQTNIKLNKISKAGIIFRVHSNHDFLSVILDISQKHGKIYLMKITKGIPFQLLTKTHISIQDNTWYNLKLSYNGSNIKLILNDEIILNSKINQNMPKQLGTLGLILLSGQCKYKNVVFTPSTSSQ